MTGLFENLTRRGVIRVAVAYLAISWLILQVIDVLGGIFELATWLAPFAFYALLVGFPVALILAWIYDVTPQGVVATEPEMLPNRFGGRKVDLAIIGSLALVIALLGGRLLTNPSGEQGPPSVSEYHQLTRSQIIFPPTPSPYPLVSDGTRIYFNDWDYGELGLRQLPHAGGDAQRMEPQFDDGVLLNTGTMTPDGKDLVVSAFRHGDRKPPDVWHVPLSGGDPRHLGPGADVSYASDGASIAYVQDGVSLAVAKPDLTDSRKLTKAQGRIHWPRFSPDDRAIRYTLQAENRSIWEVGVDAGEPRRLFPEWEYVDHCCGSWTQDGKYFVFQATVDYRTQIWALQSGNNTPAIENAKQITTGALDFRRPTLAGNDERIFTVGWQLRGELVRFDSKSERFEPLQGFDSISAEWVSFSPDADFAAYVSFPEADLWRSKSDGSRKLQLTFPPMKVIDPVWSPDQRHIAFTGRVPGEPWRIYIVSADGGAPAPLGQDVRLQLSPSWSVDGSQLAFTEAESKQIRTFYIDTGHLSSIPGSDGLYMPRWAADGKGIVALQEKNLVSLNTQSGEIHDIATNVAVERFEMSKDGKHLYVVNPFQLGRKAAALRIAMNDGSVEKITGLRDVRIPWGVTGMWVGFTPDGDPMMLRDLSIHHIYALDWLTDDS